MEEVKFAEIKKDMKKIFFYANLKTFAGLIMGAIYGFPVPNTFEANSYKSLAMLVCALVLIFSYLKLVEECFDNWEGLINEYRKKKKN